MWYDISVEEAVHVHVELVQEVFEDQRPDRLASAGPADSAMSGQSLPEVLQSW